MSKWALLILLAQAPVYKWVVFDVCQLDMSKSPPVAMRARDHSQFYLRADHVAAILEIYPKPIGIDCVQIGAPSGHQIFVIGTVETVLAKIAQ